MSYPSESSDANLVYVVGRGVGESVWSPSYSSVSNMVYDSPVWSSHKARIYANQYLILKELAKAVLLDEGVKSTVVEALFSG